MHQSHRFTLTKSPCLLHPNPHLHHHIHHHHHHHRHHLLHHHHHHCALHCHSHLCPGFASPTPPQNVRPFASAKDVNPSASQEPSNSGAPILQEQEHEGLEEEEDEEPGFVLTDEWMEFFAKSEAKRKLEKKQAKKRQN